MAATIQKSVLPTVTESSAPGTPQALSRQVSASEPLHNEANGPRSRRQSIVGGTPPTHSVHAVGNEFGTSSTTAIGGGGRRPSLVKSRKSVLQDSMGNDMTSSTASYHQRKSFQESSASSVGHASGASVLHQNISSAGSSHQNILFPLHLKASSEALDAPLTTSNTHTKRGPLNQSNTTVPGQKHIIGAHHFNWQNNPVTLTPPHPSITKGASSHVPWWMSNKLSPSTRFENQVLGELLKLVRQQANQRKMMAMNNVSCKNNPASLEDYAEIKYGPAIFEKSFQEIQRLLERAKNSEDRSHLGTPNANPTAESLDRKKRGDKEEGDHDYSGNTPQANTAHNNAMGNILGRVNHDVGLMRKPLRLILADLSKRIDLLKTNQAEWEAFQMKIAQYKAENSRKALESDNILKRNKMDLGEHTKEKRVEFYKEIRQKHDAHGVDVRKRKRALVHATLKKKMAAIQKKEDETAESQKAREKEKQGKLQLMQKRWFVIVVLASRIHRVRMLLEEAHNQRQVQLAHTHSAIIIQRGWRRYQRILLENKIKHSLQVISRVFHGYVQRRRRTKQNQASQTIRQFFKDVYEVSKLMKVVKTYRYSVLRGQQFIRHWLEVKSTRLSLLAIYWDRLASMWWTQRKLASGFTNLIPENPDGTVTDPKSKKQKASKPGKAKDDGAIALAKIPPYVFESMFKSRQLKAQMIKEDYVIRRKAYRKTLLEFETRQMNLRKRQSVFVPSADLPENRRPMWLLLPSPAEMMTMMEKAYVQSVPKK